MGPGRSGRYREDMDERVAFIAPMFEANALKLEPRAARRRAALCVIFAAVLWWHRWIPALLVVAFIGWIAVHTRFEGERGDDLQRSLQRWWPPASSVLVALIVAGTTLYGLSHDAIIAKILPIALNVLAAFMLVRAIRWPVVTSRKRAAVPSVSS